MPLAILSDQITMRIKNKEIRRRRHRKEQKMKDADRVVRAQYSGEKKPSAPKAEAKPKVAAAKAAAPKKTAEPKAAAEPKVAAPKKAAPKKKADTAEA